MEPEAKRSKLDDAVFVLNKLKGRIELRIEGIAKLLKARLKKCSSSEPMCFESEPVRIRGFDWTLIASRFSGPNNGIEFYIFCDGDSRGLRGPDWNCAASVILRCNTGSEEVEMGREDDVKFDTISTSWLCKVSI